jgi:NAD(P)-dependent dehydrogenase (short-subunit alcohol dehydrogenase family)
MEDDVQQPHPRHMDLDEAAGGCSLPIVGDIRDESQVAAAVAATVEQFSGIDVCVNTCLANRPVRRVTTRKRGSAQPRHHAQQHPSWN